MLSEYRVLDITDQRGHLAGLMLSMLGAEVIKIEPPEGVSTRASGPFDHAGNSLTHLAYDRGKKSVVLDIKSPEGRNLLLDLVEGADCLIESQGAGVLDELGLSSENFLERNPSLVMGTITAFGHTGPKAHWPATDLTLMASACTMAFTGDVDRSPLRVSVPQAFHFGAAVLAGGVIAALFERGRSGLGQVVDVAAQQVIPMATQAGVLADACNFPTPIRSGGGATVGPIDLRFVYPAKDGFVSITHVFGGAIGPVTARLMDWVLEEGFVTPEIANLDWLDFATLLESGQVSVEEWEEAKESVANCTSSKTKAELLEVAMERKLLMAPIADAGDVLASDQLRHRSYFDQIELGDIEIAAPGRFALTERSPLVSATQVAELGEHTAEVAATARNIPSSGLGEIEPSAPLDGVKVVDFMWSLAGPFTTRALADLGATVVKIESLQKPDATRGFLPIWDNEPGLERSALFDTANAGKLSLALNMNTPEALDVVHDLIGWADVLCDSFSPGKMNSWGLSWDKVQELNPRLIMLSTCLTGQFGPTASFAGYGNLGAAMSGFYGLAGWPDRAPSGPFGAYTDYTSTHFMLATVLAALDKQRRTGAGEYIDLAQTEAALHFIAPAILEASATGRIAASMGNEDSDMAPHGGFPCLGNDQWVAIAIEDDAQWTRFCRIMGRTDLASNPELASASGRRADQRMIEEAITEWTSTRSSDQVMNQLVEAGIAAHSVQSSAECLADPQLQHRQAFLWLERPDRKCVVENARFTLSRSTHGPRGPAPLLGEHTFEVLTGLLGYDVDKIAELAAAEALE
ncbi:MAG TPA: hypothetical protein DCX77_10520 [Acidimicrobiaceae bacterium]|nr:hypothetical protein [Acidimicrobiaceae bacterium]